MIGKLLGFLDLFAAAIIILFHFSIIPGKIAFIAAIYLIGKALLFLGDFFSVIDGIVGIYILLMFIIKIPLISMMMAGYLILKSIWSMM
jgi:hypothetical protein